MTDTSTLPAVTNAPLPAVQPVTGTTHILDTRFDVAGAKARLQELREFFAAVMIEGPQQDYGVVPGTDRKTLFKAGAEKLCEFYRLIQRPTVTHRVEDWDKGFFHYEVRVDLVSRDTGQIVGTGMGSCNSKESRYRWRNARRVCPDCGRDSIIRGKREFGGGWLCFAKKGGCGAKFEEAAIVDQEAGRVENDDIFSLVNTLLKMSKKRALVDAVVSVTRSAGLLIEAGEEDEDDEGASQQTSRPAGGRQSASRGTQSGGRSQPAGEAVITADEHRALNDACQQSGLPWGELVAWVRETHQVDVTKTRLPRRLYADVLAQARGPF